MPANKYALLRYRIIDKCIRNKYKPYPNKEMLRQACEDALFNSVGENVSISTIEKDLNAMRFDDTLGYNAPIVFSKTYGGYFYEDENYNIDGLPVNDDDLQALRFAATTLLQFKGIKVFEDFELAIGKIFDRVSFNQVGQDVNLKQFVQFETITEVKGNQFLPVLLQGVQNNLEIELQYAPFNSLEPKSYGLQPYLLKEYRNRWYLIAFDIGAKKMKTYGLDRVVNVELKEKKFTRTQQFLPDDFFNYALGITVSDDKPEKVVLLFQGKQINYVKSQPIHHTQKILNDSKKGLKVEIEVLNTIELQMLILGFGSSVKVISPKSLKKNIEKELTKTLQHYKK